MNRAISQPLDPGAEGRVLLRAQTNLTLETWAVFVLGLVFFSVVCVQNNKCSNKTNKHDLEMASAFASNQPYLIITVVLNFVELKNEARGLQKQGAEGTKKAAR